MGKLTRRDFLQLAWGLSKTSLLANLIPGITGPDRQNQQSPNIVVLVCDAMTALNLSLYGYSRKTTPNLEKLAEKALVYHRHYSNGNYTTPGTASLLTGLKPITHRAINASGTVIRKLAQHNIFHLLGEDYYRVGHTQNYWADYLLDQFSADIDAYLPLSYFDFIGAETLGQVFRNDSLTAHRSHEKMIYYSSSLLLSFLTSLYYQIKVKNIPTEDYEFGLPEGSYFSQPFTLEALFAGIGNKIVDLDRQSSPFFAYFHVYPPHGPYRPRKEFFELFDGDGYVPPVKPVHILSGDSSQFKLDAYRTEYDGYLANIDHEIGNLLTMLEDQGVLEHTYFILTSDHGECFERGINGHFNPLLYEPGIRIPLMIFAPGNQAKQDFFTPTNSIDLLPTILSLAGKEIPDSCEGNVLPGMGGSEDPERSIMTVEAKESTAFKPLNKATFAMIKGDSKLIYYRGYNGIYKDTFEFYNLEEDPEELHDRKDKPKYEAAISEMKQELLAAIDSADKVYS